MYVPTNFIKIIFIYVCPYLKCALTAVINYY